jgi:hypothetical protein
MFKEIAPKKYDDIKLNFACTLHWQDRISHQVVAVFANISSALAAKGITYHEEHNVCLYFGLHSH